MDEDKINTIIQAQRGEQQALTKLIKQEQNNIYATLFYLKKDENEISDIMQDILIKLTRKIGQLKNPNYFKTWLNQIIVNSYYDYLRKTKNTPKPIEISSKDENNETDIADNSTNPQEELLKDELDFVIKNSISKLPIHYKIPITLREIQGLSYGEISNITKASVGTVKSRIARARAMIKDRINKYSKE